MRKVILILAVFLPLVSFSQEEIDFSKQELFTSIDSMPYYKGGEEAMLKFINKNSSLQFVEERTKNGFVSISFIVAANGKVYEPKVLVSPTKEIGDEVTRLLKLMNWNSGIRKGKKVNVSISLLLNLK